MIHLGLIEEVFGLITRGYSWALPAMSSLGYREFQPLWEGRATAAACITQLKFNTHRFARKQGAWFRRLPHYHSLPAAAPDLMDRALSLVRSEPGLEPAHIDR
jgi:tRNA dimethylallyltransferase